MKRILIISSSFFSSGAEHSLSDLTGKLDDKYEFIMTIPGKSDFTHSGISHIYNLPLIWFYRTFNPFKLFLFASNILVCSFILIWIVKKHQINLIYANTAKANVYSVVVKIFTGRKIVWHARDNLSPTLLSKYLTKHSDTIIPVSEHIAEQVKSINAKVQIVYGGVDTKKWSTEIKPSFSLRKEMSLKNGTMLIAQIGQLTRWKNYSDFIKAADIITNKYSNVHFLIIGGDLSRRGTGYKKELERLICELGIEDRIHILGHREEINHVMPQIDILAHPAINEPFGRVLVEAMALEKPVVAYNCGGCREIIKDNVTGYLVALGNYEELAEKIICLIENEALRQRLGNAGRQRVIEKFTIERTACEMSKAFENAFLDL